MFLFAEVWVSVSCDPKDCSPPGFSVPRIFQARILEWVAMPPPGDLPNPGIEPWSPAPPVLASAFCTTAPPGKLVEVEVESLSRVRLCDSMDCSPPGSSIHGIFQAGVDCHFLLQRIFPTQGSTRVSCIVDRRFTIWATGKCIVYMRCYSSSI